MRRHEYPDSRTAAEACGNFILTRLEEVLSRRAYATLAISGGSSPKPMFAYFATRPVPWNRIHVLWVDERAVPPVHPDSNYRLAAELFVDAVPAGNVHRIRAELPPQEAAARYTDEIRDFLPLDVLHCGIGPDGHTASLFPGEPLIDDRDGIAAAVYVEKLGAWRITLLPGVLLSSRHLAVLATGPDKAAALRAVFHDPDDPRRCPAQLLKLHPESDWFIDEGARIASLQ
jgi:6-phosphogluconolactonase